jgi:hypothetical protein
MKCVTTTATQTTKGMKKANFPIYFTYIRNFIFFKNKAKNFVAIILVKFLDDIRYYHNNTNYQRHEERKFSHLFYLYKKFYRGKINGKNFVAIILVKFHGRCVSITRAQSTKGINTVNFPIYFTSIRIFIFFKNKAKNFVAIILVKFLDDIRYYHNNTNYQRHEERKFSHLFYLHKKFYIF